jgi:hypothetical protein
MEQDTGHKSKTDNRKKLDRGQMEQDRGQREKKRTERTEEQIRGRNE